MEFTIRYSFEPDTDPRRRRVAHHCRVGRFEGRIRRLVRGKLPKGRQESEDDAEEDRAACDHQSESVRGSGLEPSAVGRASLGTYASCIVRAS